MSVGAVNKSTGDRIPTAGMPAIDAALSGSSTNPVQNRVVKTALDEKADTDIVASDFSTAVSYTAGDYCIYEGKFYKFKANHSGAWAAADVDEIKIAGELSSLMSGLIGVTTTMPNQIPKDDTPNDFDNMFDRAITMYRIGNSSLITNAPANNLYGIVIAYKHAPYILQVFHHATGIYQRFSFDGGTTWETWLQVK